jgi:hypothetical protein
VLRFFLTVVLAMLAGKASASERLDDVRSYIFGNSLIHHLSPSDETTVPHWLHHLALAAGKRYAVDGQWGFPHDFIKNLPPVDQWSFKEVPDVWDKRKSSFDKAHYNTILVNPGNFIQDKPPTAAYTGFGPWRKTTVGVTLRLFDWVARHQKGPRFFIYEGWSSMGPFTKAFPPDDEGMKAFHAYNVGKYHDWYVDYLKHVKEARPRLDVNLIPVASVMAKLLTQTPLRDLTPADLYSDLGPHGTANVYFLAAVITYTKVFNAKAPESFVVPASLHPLIKDNYRQIADIVCTDVLHSAACGASADNR